MKKDKKGNEEGNRNKSRQRASAAASTTPFSPPRVAARLYAVSASRHDARTHAHTDTCAVADRVVSRRTEAQTFFFCRPRAGPSHPLTHAQIPCALRACLCARLCVRAHGGGKHRACDNAGDALIFFLGGGHLIGSINPRGGIAVPPLQGRQGGRRARKGGGGRGHEAGADRGRRR